MSQPGLFGPTEIVLTDGEHGRSVYTPEFVDIVTAARCRGGPTAG
jgi:hypothetical protein